jgi:hypothetical protein
MKRRTVVLLLVVFLASTGVRMARAQDVEGRRTWGVLTSLQGSQLEFMTPIWITGYVTLAPAVGLVWAQDLGTDLRLGMVLHIYFGQGKLAPFVGLRGGALISSPSVGESATDGLAGVLGGAEYSFDRHFAVGAELQLNMTFSSERSVRFGNPGKKTLNSASALYAAFYF